MASEIFEFDAAWADKWTKTGVPFLSAPTVIFLLFFRGSSHFIFRIVRSRVSGFISIHCNDYMLASGRGVRGHRVEVGVLVAVPPVRLQVARHLETLRQPRLLLRGLCGPGLGVVSIHWPHLALVPSVKNVMGSIREG